MFRFIFRYIFEFILRRCRHRTIGLQLVAKERIGIDPALRSFAVFYRPPIRIPYWRECNCFYVLTITLNLWAIVR